MQRLTPEEEHGAITMCVTTDQNLMGILTTNACGNIYRQTLRDVKFCVTVL